MKITFINLISAVFCVLLSGKVQAQNQSVNIPDDNFKSQLVNDENINTDGDGEISLTEAAAYSGDITVMFKNISNLTGIEAFVNITELNCGFNQLSSLNISQNTKLKTLVCRGNSIANLNLSSNLLLEYVYCQDNQLTSLDISNNTNLIELYCESNQLTSLNVANGNNANMVSMTAQQNNLTCIKHDANFDPSTKPFDDNNFVGWDKDNSANWNTNCGLGTDEVSALENKLNIFPIPAKDFVNVSVENLEAGKISIVDSSGRLVLTQLINGKHNRINISGLEKGIYFVKVGRNSKKLMVK